MGAGVSRHDSRPPARHDRERAGERLGVGERSDHVLRGEDAVEQLPGGITVEAKPTERAFELVNRTELASSRPKAGAWPQKPH